MLHPVFNNLERVIIFCRVDMMCGWLTGVLHVTFHQWLKGNIH